MRRHGFAELGGRRAAALGEQVVQDEAVVRQHKQPTLPGSHHPLSKATLTRYGLSAAAGLQPRDGGSAAGAGPGLRPLLVLSGFSAIGFATSPYMTHVQTVVDHLSFQV
eukprot:74269-Hanusia_phi.AAC.1